MIIAQIIAKELSVTIEQIKSTIQLIDDGATIPFIARYRKEVTQGLDDTQLRFLNERLIYLRELESRRSTILESIKEQQKLTPELEKQILQADNKAKLEDLYLPYKPKRRTKGQIAIEAGLEPLADKLYQNPQLVPEQEVLAFVNQQAGFEDAQKVLQGAQYILMERFSENADIRQKLREYLSASAMLVSQIIKEKEKEGQKYQDYFEYQENYAKVPSHRALALFRGRKEGILSLSLKEPEEINNNHPSKPGEYSKAAFMVAEHFSIKDEQRGADKWLKQTVYLTWRVKLFTSLELELFSELKEKAESVAIDVFAKNLKDLLMAAPAGVKRVLGLDPGIRTGVKTAVVDETGKVLATTTIYPFQPQNKYNEALMTLVALVKKHDIDLIAIGNGTASRETDKLASECIENIKQTAQKALQKIIVSEAGASVYSASELAAKEMPELDVSLRGAVSIARRLQDPLAELVKIDPKSIGVGQYQHDVSQVKLSRSLDGVVEDCVNAVGVDLNTASAPLLTRISGLSETLANNIVDYRNNKGRFDSRDELKVVPRLGPKAFEQAAGFLRVNHGKQALDSSSVHPEAYDLTMSIIKDLEISVEAAIGNAALKKVKAEKYANEQFGTPTIIDILNELEKPGRDPRPDFKTASFTEGVENIADLKLGSWLEGVISNVTQFGAFVDLGVHQDGLVHISMMSNDFIKDPRDVVKAGDVVKVKVIEVDIARKRIALSMVDKQVNPVEKTRGKTPDKTANKERTENYKKSPKAKDKHSSSKYSSSKPSGAMANAFAKLKP